MPASAVIPQLLAKAGELETGLELTWHAPPTPPADPLAPADFRSWPVWNADAWTSLRKNAPNWFYASLVFPPVLHGLRLTNEKAYIYIHGYCPFTLWVDGVEAFAETHAWHATGPIADPVVTLIEPGREYRLALCLEPTEIPFRFNPIGVAVRPLPCVEQAVDVQALAAELRIAEGFARTRRERDTVRRAAAAVDLSALAADDWPAFADSATRAEKLLAPFAGRTRAMTVHLIGHTHIDLDWQWTWKDTVLCARRDIRAAVELLEDFPELRFSLSQVPVYQVARELDPALFDRVRRLIAEGRWENVASTWVEGDLNMADGEAVVRQMRYAAQWGERELGCRATVFWAPDTFGHPGNMPQLAMLGGCDTYFHWRGNPGGADNWPVRWWRGVDGTRILAVSSAYGGGLQPGIGMWQALHGVQQYQRFGLRNAHHVWGGGDHGGGLARHHLDILERYRRRPLMPVLRFSTVREFREAVLAEGAKLPGNTGESFHLFEGCFTSHARIKAYNRRCETALLTAEALTALAEVDAGDELRAAWTSVLFNQFHDIFDGAAVADSYRDAFARAETSLAAADEITGRAVAALACGPAGDRPRTGVDGTPHGDRPRGEPGLGCGGRVGGAAAASPAGDRPRMGVDGTVPGDRPRDAVILWNPLGFERGGLVRTRCLPAGCRRLQGTEGAVPVQWVDGEAVFLSPPVPAFSWGRLEADDTPSPDDEGSAVRVTEAPTHFEVDSPRCRVRLCRESGILTSYCDKASARELVGYGVPKTLSHVPVTRKELALNVFQIIDESPNPMSSWLIHEPWREECLVRGATVECLDRGPLVARFRVTHRVRSSQITEEIWFHRDLAGVWLDVRVDWQEPCGPEAGVPQLKLAFAASLRAPRARFEGPFSVVERPADGLETVTQKWADLTGDEGGFTLCNDSRYGCDALGGRLRVTLVRNAYSPDPCSDRGVHRVQLAFEPHGAAPLRFLKSARATKGRPSSRSGRSSACCSPTRCRTSS
ncbi:MAG: alpha-mannosidase [Lentisphaerae bacterium ADurb.BinA184]|nr:MAG: alpha-mannosidase [Lentisphaerae bacterium ADurb.BinA184]